MKNKAFDRAVDDVSEVFMFDNWMRFYFIFEEGKKLIVKVPQDVVDQIEKDFPTMHGLVELFNNEEIDQQKSTQNVCAFIGARFDGTKYSDKIVPKVFDSKEFKIETYLFNLWIKGHESYLETEVMGFADWKELYAGWKEQDEVKDYISRLKNAGSGAAIQPPTCTTIQ
ncbi:hypothetical protein [Maridesulfovibrio ferrireducens]|uniref:Uncharacterized protein n=1 Tax=Maridesulfovibrio ferrireducens TaxID=246191 RepID=A0A1G9KIN2_9BACT|nr:hypothetical protein [Maridesulfovibrio ferrireducens]MBI9110739.1 hypothetical protein [Maridesulfovibrio ferrireducens]SDL49648.1 hypothetical protein SAMN05660337_3102 [Maridesulfovibrio ferrireducens]